MLARKRKVVIETERLTLRLPRHSDFSSWASIRSESVEFLTPWEPAWASDHLTRRSFTNRVYWAQKSFSKGSAVPVFLERRADRTVLGAITLDNIRRGPAQAGTLGYWIGAQHARQGFMREAAQSYLQINGRWKNHVLFANLRNDRRGKTTAR